MANLEEKKPRTPARVTYSVAFTMNLGDFQSVKMNVGLTQDDVEEDLDATFDGIKSWVDTKLQEAMNDAKEDFDKLKKSK